MYTKVDVSVESNRFTLINVKAYLPNYQIMLKTFLISKFNITYTQENLEHRKPLMQFKKMINVHFIIC